MKLKKMMKDNKRINLKKIDNSFPLISPQQWFFNAFANFQVSLETVSSNLELYLEVFELLSKE